MSNINSFLATFRSKKAGREQAIKFGDLPESSQQAIIAYGAQRFINDKLGGSDIGQKEAAEQFDKILEQLAEGWIDRRGTGGSASVDPVERETQKLARERVKAALKAKGVPLKEVSKEKMAEFTEQVLAKYRTELEEKAKTIVEAQNTKLDLDGLDLDI